MRCEEMAACRRGHNHILKPMNTNWAGVCGYSGRGYKDPYVHIKAHWADLDMYLLYYVHD